MFSITQGKGFHIKFANGWTVSVQFGPDNYCDNYNLTFGPNIDGERLAGHRGSATAEVAVNHPTGYLIDLGGDTVRGYQTADQVLALMAEVAALAPEAPGLPSVAQKER